MNASAWRASVELELPRSVAAQSLRPEDDWEAPLNDPAETAAFCRLVQRSVELLRPLRVLDVGCGTGLPTLQAARAGAHRVVGIDVVPRNVFITRKHIRAEGLESRVTAHAASWEDVVRGDFYPGNVNLVISNPPYVPDGEGVAVDGGSTGTRMLDAIVDGMPKSARGLGLLFGSLSDPLQVLSRIERGGFDVLEVRGCSVPFGSYTSRPRTLARLRELRTQNRAWFCDAIPQASLAPHQYLTLGVIAVRREPASSPQPSVLPKLGQLLDDYQRKGPTVLSGNLLIGKL